MQWVDCQYSWAKNIEMVQETLLNILQVVLEDILFMIALKN